MKTWRQLEKLVDDGKARHIGTSNMTIPKLGLLLRNARIKPAVNEMELHPHFQQPELFQYCLDHDIVPIGYSPIGSPGRPERDRTAEDTLDCSGNDKGRLLCIQATRQWGKCVMIGEGGTVSFNPSPDIIHEQKTIYGSWVTNIWRMEELVERLVRWGVHPADLVTHRFALDKADEAYELMAGRKCGKVAVVFDEELT